VEASSTPFGDEKHLGASNGRDTSHEVGNGAKGSVEPALLLEELKGEREYILLCIQTIESLCRIYNFTGPWDPTTTVDHWTALVKHCPQVKHSWVKVAKYKLAAFFSAHMPDRQKIPKAPFKEILDHPHQLVGGRLGNWIRDFLDKPKEPLSDEDTLRWLSQRISFLTSVLQVKKGMPRPGATLVGDKEREAFEKLTTPGEVKESVSYRTPRLGNGYGTISQENLIFQIKRTVREIFQRFKFDEEARFKAAFPSTSANYWRSRGEGGAVAALLQGKVFTKFLEPLRRKGGYLRVNRQGQGANLAGDDSSEKISKAPTQEIEPSSRERLKQVWGKLWNELRMAAYMMEEPIAEPVGLAEPLKVRVITKGPVLANIVLRPYWSFLHSIMRNHRLFKLIGQPVTEEYLLDQLGRQPFPQGRRFISGDYEDATNNMQKFAATAVIEALGEIHKLDHTERVILRNNATDHWILFNYRVKDKFGKPIPKVHRDYYIRRNEELKPQMFPHVSKKNAQWIRRGPDHWVVIDDDGLAAEIKKQKRGTLMGDIMSFIILNVINCAMVRWSVEVDQDEMIPLHELKAMFNGDDCLWLGSDRGYVIWGQIAALSGMTESIGKTYVSESFVNINSRNFIVDKVNSNMCISERTFTEVVTRTETKQRLIEGKDGKEPDFYDLKHTFLNSYKQKSERMHPFHTTKFVNMGLLTGQKRSGLISEDGDSTKSIGARYRELIEDCPKYLRKEVHYAFIKQNEETLRSTFLPWFMPEWIGGLELYTKNFRITPKNGETYPKKKDLQIATRILMQWRKVRPIPLSRKMKSWLIWKKASEAAPDANFTMDKDDQGIAKRQDMVGLFALNILFDSNVMLQDIFPKPENAKEALKKMEKIKNETMTIIRHNEKLWKDEGWRPTKNIVSERRLLSKTVYETTSESTSIDFSEENELEERLD
jgi:hypothetical protein